MRIFRVFIACLAIIIPSANSFSQVGPGAARKYDVFYYNVPSSGCDITTRLDLLWEELKKEPGSRGYIIGYGGRRQPLSKVPYPPASWKQYLVEMRELAEERVLAVGGGLREEAMVELWIVPRDAEPPEPTPTIFRKRRGRR